MNPALLRELDAEGAAIVRLIGDIPRGREYDMAGHMDAKRAAMRRLERLMKRVREEAGGPRAVSPFGQSGKVIFPVATRRRPRP